MTYSTFYRSLNKMRLKPTMLLVSMPILTALAGCSSNEPTLGDIIREQGTGLAAIGDQWAEGHERLEEGRFQIEQGQEMINEGESLLATGNDNVRTGQQAKQQAEQNYRERTGRELPIITQ